MLTPAGDGPLYDELPADDFLVSARRADLELARKIAAECRRPTPDWNRDVVGPTEAWRDFLAATDPEWSSLDDEADAEVSAA